MEEMTFKNAFAVLQHLAGQGWKVGKTIFYCHVKEGKLRPREDGAFELAAVNKYAKAFLKRSAGTGRISTDEIDRLHEKRLRAEVEKTEGQAQVWTSKARILNESYVPRDLFETELAKRALVYRNDLEGFCRSEAAGIIAYIDGDSGKLSDLIAFLLEKVNVFLERYSVEGQIFQVPAYHTIAEDGELDNDDDAEEEDA